MKIYNKGLLASILVSITLVIADSCVEPDELITSSATTGGLIGTTTPSLNYVVGNNGPYDLQFIVPSNAHATTIKLYNRFTTSPKFKITKGLKIIDTIATYTSNKVLLKTIILPSAGTQTVNTTITYSELIADLEVTQLTSNLDPDYVVEPISAVDGDRLIGDRWTLSAVIVTDDGREIEQPFIISAIVATRYAGTYKVVEGEYFRIHLPRPDVTWPSTMIIESVDAITYRQIEYFGPFNSATSANEVYFTIVNGVIDYPTNKPDGSPQIGNDNPLITCLTNPDDMVDVYCSESNIVINDDVNGKDQLIMSYGYSVSTGPRTMYSKLEKIIE